MMSGSVRTEPTLTPDRPVFLVESTLNWAEERGARVPLRERSRWVHSEPGLAAADGPVCLCPVCRHAGAM